MCKMRIVIKYKFVYFLREEKEMKRILFCLFFGLIVVIIHAQQITVAVRTFEISGGLTQDEGDAITDLFISELVTTGRVRVVDRNSFNSILREMNFQLSDWSDDNKVARLGRGLNANHIIQGSVTRLGSRINLTIRILDINTLQYISSPNLQLTNMDEIFTKLRPYVVNFVVNLPGVSRTYNIRDIGPSGGYVFFDKGSYSDGWRYLEAAPVSFEFTSTSYTDVYDRCTGLIINGLIGWRVPTADELRYMYGNLFVNGLGSFSGSLYWSSNSERTNANANYYYSRNIVLNFSDGTRSWQASYDRYNTFARAVRAF